MLQCLNSPVEGGVVQEKLDTDVLLQEAVGQDGHGGEADVVHREIGGIVQGLGRTGGGAGGAGGGGEDRGVGQPRVNYREEETTLRQCTTDTHYGTLEAQPHLAYIQYIYNIVYSV